MRIGNIEIKLADKKPPAKPTLGEMGGSGTIFFQGLLTEEEYNADLKGAKSIAVYDKMRRSDGQVKAALLACELPLRSATWSIEPASEDAKDVEVADFIEENLLNGMTITWDSFLHHVLMMLAFGFSIFEKVFESVDGQYQWRKFAPRLPKSLYSWKLDEEGGLAGITQYVQKGTTFQFVDILVEKLLVFTHDREGSNFQGISLLRAAYKHWYYKDNLYRIDGIAAERHGVGLPVMKYPPGITEDDKKRLDAIGESLHAHERNYVRLPNDYTFEMVGMQGQVRNIIPSIEHHDMQIARSILAQFLNLGDTSTGSFALSQDQSSFFLMSLKAMAKNICDTMNRYAIKQLVDYNFEVDQYPKLAISNLETRQTKDLAQAVSQLITAGAITPNNDLEAALLDIFGLPPPPEPKKQQSEKVFQGAEVKKKRELKDAETHVAFADINKALDDAVAEFVAAASKIQKKQIDKLADVAAKIIEKKQLGKVDDIDVPYRIELANAIQGVLERLYHYGREQVRQELSSQKKARNLAEPPFERTVINPEDMAAIKAFLSSRAKATSNILGIKLKNAVTWESLKQMKIGTLDKVALLESMTELSDRELKSAAQYSVNEAFGFGRGAEAATQIGDIDRVFYSAIMDENTCSHCEALDGHEWDSDAPEVELYASGNPACDGAGRCRCLLVYVHKGESKAVR